MMLTRLPQPLHEFIHISGAILYLNLLERYIVFDDELYCHKWIGI